MEFVHSHVAMVGEGVEGRTGRPAIGCGSRAKGVFVVRGIAGGRHGGRRVEESQRPRDVGGAWLRLAALIGYLLLPCGVGPRAACRNTCPSRTSGLIETGLFIFSPLPADTVTAGRTPIRECRDLAGLLSLPIHVGGTSAARLSDIPAI